MRIAAIISVLTVMVLGSGVPGLTESATNDLLIVPGQRIGPLRVGMSITDATALMGTPKPAITNLVSVVLTLPDGSTVFRWPPSSEAQQYGANSNDGFGVVADKAGAIFEIQGPFDGRYHTAEGLHVGSKVSEVTKTLGAPPRQPTSGHERFYVYDQPGIVMLVQDNRGASNYGLVNGMWVFSPRTTP